MDERDRKILKCLDRDARISLTDISKELKIPVTTIKFRIEKMVEDGIIQQFTTLLNPDILGYTVFALLTVETEKFLVSGIAQKMVDELFQKLEKDPRVQFAAAAEGGRLVMICVFKTTSELRDFLSELETTAGVKNVTFEILEKVSKGRGIRGSL